MEINFNQLGKYGIPPLDVDSSMLKNRSCLNLSTMPSTLRYFMCHCIGELIANNHKVVVFCSPSDFNKVQDLVVKNVSHRLSKSKEQVIDMIKLKKRLLLKSINYHINYLELIQLCVSKYEGFFFDLTSVKFKNIEDLESMFKTIKRFKNDYSIYFQINMTTDMSSRNRIIKNELTEYNNLKEVKLASLVDCCNFISTNKRINKKSNIVVLYNLKKGKKKPLIGFLVLKISRECCYFSYCKTNQFGLYK